MNQIRNWILSLGLIAFSMTAHADSNGGRGGGDTILLRAEDIAKYVAEDASLKADLTSVLQSGVIQELDDPNLRAPLMKMLEAGWLGTVQVTTFTAVGPCHDESGVEKVVTLSRGLPHPLICLNLNMLTKSGTVKSSDLVGLAAHGFTSLYSVVDTVDDPIRGNQIHPIQYFITDQVKVLGTVGLQTRAQKSAKCSQKALQCSIDATAEASRCLDQNGVNCFAKKNKDETACLAEGSVCASPGKF